MQRRAVGLGLCLASGLCACVFIRETLQLAMGKDSFCLIYNQTDEDKCEAAAGLRQCSGRSVGPWRC